MTSPLEGFNPPYTENAPTLEQVKALTGNTILEFGAPWCGHCQAAEPAIEEVLNESTELNQIKIHHIKLYDGKGKPLGRAYKVKLWPTLILLQNGVEIARLVRPTSANEIRQLVTSQLA